MTREQLALRLKNACQEVIAAEAELTEIDSRFGDADHGLTMSKIAHAIEGAVDGADGTIQEMLDDAAMAVMSLNGGSAVPLWNTWLDGMQEGAPEAEETDIAGIQAIFARALEEIDDMSGARGVDMGRNIFQSDHPAAMCQAVAKVVHEGSTDKEAYQFYQELSNT